MKHKTKNKFTASKLKSGVKTKFKKGMDYTENFSKSYLPKIKEQLKVVGDKLDEMAKEYGPKVEECFDKYSRIYGRKFKEAFLAFQKDYEPQAKQTQKSTERLKK